MFEFLNIPVLVCVGRNVCELASPLWLELQCWHIFAAVLIARSRVCQIERHREGEGGEDTPNSFFPEFCMNEIPLYLHTVHGWGGAARLRAKRRETNPLHLFAYLSCFFVPPSVPSTPPRLIQTFVKIVSVFSTSFFCETLFCPLSHASVCQAGKGRRRCLVSEKTNLRRCKRGFLCSRNCGPQKKFFLKIKSDNTYFDT